MDVPLEVCVCVAKHVDYTIWLATTNKRVTPLQDFLKVSRLTIVAVWCKGQSISKCLFGVFNFFQKTNKNKSTWGIIVVVKSNSFVCFLEETSAWKNHFDFVWPLGYAETKICIYQIVLMSCHVNSSKIHINSYNLFNKAKYICSSKLNFLNSFLEDCLVGNLWSFFYFWVK